MLKMNSMRFFYLFLPAENKDGRAPFVEELESPVVDGGGVDLEEVLEDRQPGSGNSSQSRHVSSPYSTQAHLSMQPISRLVEGDIILQAKIFELEQRACSYLVEISPITFLKD